MYKPCHHLVKKIKTPWMDSELLKVGARFEMVIRIFEDDKRSKLLGEHYHFDTF